MNVVVDTNVIISGLLKPFSLSGQIMRWVADGKLTIWYDARILLEYEQVLRRDKFGFDPAMVTVLMDAIKEMGVCAAGSSAKVHLPDPADEMFVEVASDSQCRLLLTGNSKHFPQKACGKVKVLNPREFMAFFEVHQ
jgi:putative PIN family toxin of toxin-antitoxin system